MFHGHRNAARTTSNTPTEQGILTPVTVGHLSPAFGLPVADTAALGERLVVDVDAGGRVWTRDSGFDGIDLEETSHTTNTATERGRSDPGYSGRFQKGLSTEVGEDHSVKQNG